MKCVVCRYDKTLSTYRGQVFCFDCVDSNVHKIYFLNGDLDKILKAHKRL